ncbi:MAG: hypothetical protein HGB33_06885 [Syntrophaceae bacterium]|nr:hypothetical protein [Syntrophaceae bacterium]
MNSERLMAKAQRALAAATRAAQAGDTETAADRVYYSVYYAAWALLDSIKQSSAGKSMQLVRYVRG